SIQSDAPHPDPDSCPTRRSSDLFVRGDNNCDDTNTNASSDKDAPPKAKKGSPKKKPKNDGTVISYQASDMVDVMRRACFWGRERDRKSTRLNSSHVSISYAVFCL